jgi:hypothetical protein
VTRPLVARVRPFLFLLGLLLLAYLVHRAGPERVLRTARAGLGYLPLLVLCQAAFSTFESFGQRCLLGPDAAKLPTPVFLRTTAGAYAASVLVPVGRASAEAVRVGAYANYVGGARALAASTSFQVPALWGTAVLGALCVAASSVVVGPGSPLTWILAVHALGSFALGGVLLLVLERGALGSRLARFFPGLAERAQSFDQALAVPGRLHARALGWCVLARGAEVCHSSLLLLAVGLPLVPTHGILIAGIQIVGSTAGEAIPGQLGAVEGAFAYFAPALGLPPHSPLALTIPLMGRVAQYGLAALTLLLLNPWSAGFKKLPGSQPSSPAPPER